MTTLAYSHTLVAGTPENINDVQDMFNDVKTLVNGNLDATNLAASARPATVLGAYRTVHEATFALDSTNTGATTYVPTVSSSTSPVRALSTAGLSAIVFCPLTVADYSVSGLTTQFRVQGSVITNGVAPGVSFTYSVAQITNLNGTGNAIGISGTGTLLGSVTRTTPGANSAFVDSSAADFTISTSGTYVMLLASSGSPAANSNTQFCLRLQVHHI